MDFSEFLAHKQTRAFISKHVKKNGNFVKIVDQTLKTSQTLSNWRQERWELRAHKVKKIICYSMNSDRCTDEKTAASSK